MWGSVLASWSTSSNVPCSLYGLSLKGNKRSSRERNHTYQKHATPRRLFKIILIMFKVFCNIILMLMTCYNTQLLKKPAHLSFKLLQLLRSSQNLRILSFIKNVCVLLKRRKEQGEGIIRWNLLRWFTAREPASYLAVCSAQYSWNSGCIWLNTRVASSTKCCREPHHNWLCFMVFYSCHFIMWT